MGVEIVVAFRSVSTSWTQPLGVPDVKTVIPSHFTANCWPASEYQKSKVYSSSGSVAIFWLTTPVAPSRLAAQRPECANPAPQITLAKPLAFQPEKSPDSNP